MAKATIPPSVEQKDVKGRRRKRGFFRFLVGRSTLLVAFRIVWIVFRVMRFVMLLFGSL